MPIVFASGDTLGRLRFEALIGRFQDFVLYRAEDEVKRRAVLVRQYVPENPEQAMSGLPAAGRHAKSRWDQLLDIQLQRFELARGALPATSPNHVSLIDHLIDDTFFAIMAHPAAARLVAEFGEIRSPSEPALHQLLLSIIEVLSGLHRKRVLYGGLGSEEILLDRTEPGSLGVPVLAGFGSVYQWGGIGAPRPRADDRSGWAPEFLDRQARLTPAADVYALGALAYRLMTGTSPNPARVRLKGSEHPPVSDLAPSYSSSLRRAVDQALALDPEARFSSITAFRESALPAVVQPTRGTVRPGQPTPPPSRTRPRTKTRDWAKLIAGIFGRIGAAVSKLSSRQPVPVRARRSRPNLKPVLDVARAGFVEALERLKPSARPRLEKPAQPKPVPVTPRPARAPAAKAQSRTGTVVAPAVIQAAGAFLARQWQPMVAACIVLAIGGGAWWLRSVEVWPQGPFERSASLPASALPPAPKEDPTLAGPMAAVADAPPLATPEPKPVSPAPEQVSAPPEPQHSRLVADIQSELKRLGFYAGEIDGLDAPAVQTAIVQARKKYAMAGPAQASKRLLRQLKAQAVAPPAATPEPPPAPAPTLAKAPTIEPARPKKVADVQYPRGAMVNGIEGWVEVTFDIDPEGGVQNARVTASESTRARKHFGDPALRAVRAGSFYPALRDGKPIWTRSLMRRVVFKLQER